MRFSLTAILLLAVGCAPAPAGAPPGTALLPDTAADVSDWDRVGLENAEIALDSGWYALATQIADSLHASWLDVRVPTEGVRRLAQIYLAAAEEPRAAELLAGALVDLGGGERDLLRRAAQGLSLAELEELTRITPLSERTSAVVQAELARALALSDHADSAVAVAQRADTLDADREDRRTLESVAAGLIIPDPEPVRIGVILPGTGRFTAVGEQLLEGALLALEEYRLRVDTAAVELVVLDDSSSTDLASGLVQDLERRGVVGVVGPIRSDALRAAAVSRTSPGLALVSPTATEGAGLPPHAYTLWDREQRENDAAVVLVEWMTAALGVGTFGVLYPITEPAGYEVIREAVEERGAEIVDAEAYDPDSTTFAGPVSALSEQVSEAVIVLASSPRTVLQMGPQLVYYGLRSRIIGGGPAWADPAVVRRLDPSYADYRVTAAYVDRVRAGTPWKRFEELYEIEYRKSLPDNMFSALGFDATALLLRALPADGLRRPGAVARRLRGAERYEGATGSIAFDAETGSLRRQVKVLMLLEGTLMEPDAEAILAWAEEQRQLEEFLKELEEEKMKEEEGGEGQTEDGRTGPPRSGATHR